MAQLVTKTDRLNYWIVSTEFNEASQGYSCCQTWNTSANLPENYAFISHEQMEEYYKKEDENGQPFESAGHVDMTWDDAIDEDGNIIGKIITSCVWSNEKYNTYQNSLPNPVPGIIDQKITEAESKPAEIMAQGVPVNSLNLATTFLNLDGTSDNNANATFSYDEFTQDEILKAYVACHSGMKNYTLKLRNKRAVKLPAEAIYRLYIECETAKRMQEAYSEVYIEFLSSHRNDDRDMKNTIRNYTYGETELPEEYENELSNMQDEIMDEMMELAETLGINE